MSESKLLRLYGRISDTCHKDIYGATCEDHAMQMIREAYELGRADENEALKSADRLIDALDSLPELWGTQYSADDAQELVDGLYEVDPIVEEYKRKRTGEVKA